jgi:hypothetical protein
VAELTIALKDLVDNIKVANCVGTFLIHHLSICSDIKRNKNNLRGE